MSTNQSGWGRLRRIIIGAERDPTDADVFHKLSLVAFLAWVGLGSDGISSACYGPEEGFLALGAHPHLAVLLAIMAAVTVVIISASYAQIIEVFPSGGGGYLVASKLLHPTVGMVSGCALVVDYVLTITISIAAGNDAVFSFLPVSWQAWKMPAAFALLALLVVLNLRGAKESVLPLVPVFLLFILTHAIAILYAVGIHLGDLPGLVHKTSMDVHASAREVGWMGLVIVLLRAYSLGGGTYTGIEAISNGLSMLREPRVQTGKRTMLYMAVSLAFMASGLILAYLLLGVTKQEGRTLNAAVFDAVAGNWPGGGAFIVTALGTEALILLVAAQSGFLAGPRVLANLALDGWMPNRFSLLSDRLTTQNGILIFAAAAGAILYLTHGSVAFLVVLYSINVFLTFTLSQLGMVVYWWKHRRDTPTWRRRLTVNGTGFLITGAILVAVVALKFAEGGWLTLALTGSLIAAAFLIRHEYQATRRGLRKLDALVDRVTPTTASPARRGDGGATAVLLVSGYNGMGLHVLLNVLHKFPRQYTRFVFMQVGLIDAGKFKGVAEVDELRQDVTAQAERYVEVMQAAGYDAEAVCSVGTDVIDELEKLASSVADRFPGAVFFSGQLVFKKDNWVSRLLHNYTGFVIQRRLYLRGLPVVVLPVRL